MTAVVALHRVVAIAPQAQYSWFVPRGELKQVDDAHRPEGVPPLATAVRRLLHEHLDLALAGSAEAWEVEPLYITSPRPPTPWLSWVGSTLTAEAEAMGEHSTWPPNSR
jgi:hypothetical protein